MQDTTSLIQLLRKMAHDMRVPLNTIISTGDMLAEGVYDPLTAKQAKAITRLQRNNVRLLAILDDFIAYVKADAGEMVLANKVFDPRTTLDDRYHAGTYGIPDAVTLDAIRLAGRLEGMITDPVYEGKSMAGLIGMIRSGEIPRARGESDGGRWRWRQSAANLSPRPALRLQGKNREIPRFSASTADLARQSWRRINALRPNSLPVGTGN